MIEGYIITGTWNAHFRNPSRIHTHPAQPILRVLYTLNRLYPRPIPITLSRTRSLDTMSARFSGKDKRPAPRRSHHKSHAESSPTAGQEVMVWSPRAHIPVCCHTSPVSDSWTEWSTKAQVSAPGVTYDPYPLRVQPSIGTSMNSSGIEVPDTGIRCRAVITLPGMSEERQRQVSHMLYWVNDALTEAVNIPHIQEVLDTVASSDGDVSFVSVPAAVAIMRDTCIPRVQFSLRDMMRMSGCHPSTLSDDIRVKHILPALREAYRREHEPSRLESEIGEMIISVRPIEQVPRQDPRCQWTSLATYSRHWHHSALPVFRTVASGSSTVLGQPGPWVGEDNGGGSFTFAVNPASNWPSLFTE